MTETAFREMETKLVDRVIGEDNLKKDDIEDTVFQYITDGILTGPQGATLYRKLFAIYEEHHI